MTIDDQPHPVPNGGSPLWDLVIADMRERDQIGRQRYGTPLQAFNGRDALVDAYQEALDHAVYLRQAIEERRLLTAALTMIVADIDLSYWDDTRRHMHRDEWLTWVRREVEAWFVRAALDAGQQR